MGNTVFGNTAATITGNSICGEEASIDAQEGAELDIGDNAICDGAGN